MHNGVEHFSISEKLKIAMAFFQDIFSSRPNDPLAVDLAAVYSQVDFLDLSTLEKSFSWDEIVRAIKLSPNNRSHGPDGFTNEFYKKFASALKDDVLMFFDDFFHG